MSKKGVIVFAVASLLLTACASNYRVFEFDDIGNPTSSVHWVDADQPERLRLAHLSPTPVDDSWGRQSVHFTLGATFVRYLDRTPQFDYLYLYLEAPADEAPGVLDDSTHVTLTLNPDSEPVRIEASSVLVGQRLIDLQPHTFLLIPLTPAQYVHVMQAQIVRARVGEYHGFQASGPSLARLEHLLQALPADLRFPTSSANHRAIVIGQ